MCNLLNNKCPICNLGSRSKLILGCKIEKNLLSNENMSYFFVHFKLMHKISVAGKRLKTGGDYTQHYTVIFKSCFLSLHDNVRTVSSSWYCEHFSWISQLYKGSNCLLLCGIWKIVCVYLFSQHPFKTQCAHLQTHNEQSHNWKKGRQAEDVL